MSQTNRAVFSLIAVSSDFRFLFYLHPCRALIDFYFLYSHHLTAFLGMTLLIRGIASLLASDVVLCHRPKLVWNSFISYCCFSHLTSFSAVRCLYRFQQFDSCKAQRCWASRLPHQIDRCWYHFPELHFHIYFIINSMSRNSPDQITVTVKAICHVSLVGLLLRGRADAGCNYQENWALFLFCVF